MPSCDWPTFITRVGAYPHTNVHRANGLKASPRRAAAAAIEMPSLRVAPTSCRARGTFSRMTSQIVPRRRAGDQPARTPLGDDPR
jgi:hypothetical protein